MKVGARNNITGKINEIKKGKVMCQVTVAIDNPIAMSSVLTLDSLKELGVKKGDRVSVIVKAVNVLLIRP